MRSSRSVFLHGRQIIDNIILSGECIKTLQSKAKKPKRCTLKLDMSKAFNRIEWHYIINIPKALEFCDKWCQLINWCISSTSIYVSINDQHFDSTKPSRGIRQGDSISHYLFILASKGLLDSVKELKKMEKFMVSKLINLLQLLVI